MQFAIFFSPSNIEMHSHDMHSIWQKKKKIDARREMQRAGEKTAHSANSKIHLAFRKKKYIRHRMCRFWIIINVRLYWINRAEEELIRHTAPTWWARKGWSSMRSFFLITHFSNAIFRRFPFHNFLSEQIPWMLHFLFVCLFVYFFSISVRQFCVCVCLFFLAMTDFCNAFFVATFAVLC